MKRAFIILAVLLLANVDFARATDLDAPAIKPVTVRSEIDRGYSAALATAVDTHSPLDFERAAAAVLHQNIQNRADTDAFRLGLAFGAWQNMWLMLSLDGAFDLVHGKKLDQSKLAALFGDSYHKEFRSNCDKVGVTPDQLKELFGRFNYDPARDDAAWEAAVKAQKFRGTLMDAGPPKKS